MIFAELIQRNFWIEIAKRMLELYPEEKGVIDKYKQIFFSIKTLKRKNNKGMKIYIHHNRDNNTEDVYGIDRSFEKDLDGNLILDDKGNPILVTWALEFQTWEFWSSLFIDETSLKNYGDIDFICHVLYEMTVYGYDQESIAKVRDKIDKRCDEIDNGTAKYVSSEEVKQHLEELIKSWEKK
jgi:hypothetical protein